MVKILLKCFIIKIYFILNLIWSIVSFIKDTFIESPVLKDPDYHVNQMSSN